MNNALDAYITEVQTAESLLDTLGLFVDDHGEVSPDDVTWANVENMKKLVSILDKARTLISTGLGL